MKSKTTVKPAEPPKAAVGEFYGRAAALHLAGKPQEALEQIEQAIAAGEQGAEVYAAAGYLHYERRQFEQSAEAYRKLVALVPANGAAWFNLAAALQALGKWDEAGALFEKALAADPNRYEAHLGLGLSRLHMGAARPALEAYDRCLRLIPNLEPVRLEPILFGKAAALQLLKKFAEAAELYNRVLEQNPRSEEALTNAISAHLELKDHSAAARCAEQLLKIRPDSRIAHSKAWLRRLLLRRIMKSCRALRSTSESGARCLRGLVQSGSRSGKGRPSRGCQGLWRSFAATPERRRAATEPRCGLSGRRRSGEG